MESIFLVKSHAYFEDLLLLRDEIGGGRRALEKGEQWRREKEHAIIGTILKWVVRLMVVIHMP